MAATIPELISRGDPDAPAVVSLTDQSASYADVSATVDRIAGQLRALGLERGDPVALVLPNGPEMAMTFLATASCVTAAPLNPAYRTSEFGYYLQDLGAKALITRGEGAAEAREALSPKALRLELVGSGAEVTLAQDGRQVPWQEPAWADADDVALILHTSGTTAKPKIVPLDHRNLTTSAGNMLVPSS